MNTKAFKLPKYLKLGKGSMWFDVDGENASGVKIYAKQEAFIGRGKELGADVVKDKFENENLLEYGYIDKELPWYFDTTTIPGENLDRIINAFKHGILIKADPKEPPTDDLGTAPVKDFKHSKEGDLVFIGKNKEMYKKLQTLSTKDLVSFINTCPQTEQGKMNLQDLYEYEQKAYNRVSRARGNILDLIRQRLNVYGPSLGAIRINDE